MKKKIESIDDLKAKLRALPKSTVKPADLLRTGSTLLDLACSGKLAGGIPKGCYVLFVGDSTSGKTWFCLSTLAEATINRHFDDYALILDAPENGALMDIERFFGRRLLERLETEYVSNTVEDFYRKIKSAMADGPCIYVLDSMDALDSEEDEERGKGYGTGKAKANSAQMRKISRLLEKTGSILIVICQTRATIGFAAKFTPKRRSGGDALRFFTDIELWSSVAGKIQPTIRGKKRQLGILSRIKVDKNRYLGRLRTVTIPIFHSAGVDDLGSCIEYLIEEGKWKSRKKGNVEAPEFDHSGSIESLITQIESCGRERELRSMVATTWNEIEAACMIQRKNRYE